MRNMIRDKIDELRRTYGIGVVAIDNQQYIHIQIVTDLAISDHVKLNGFEKLLIIIIALNFTCSKRNAICSDSVLA